MTKVAEFPKNTREVVRASVGDFKGNTMLNLRVWYRDAEGELRPGKQGLAIRADLAPDLLKAIQEVQP